MRGSNIRHAIAALGSEPHDYKTAVLDSLDKLEGVIWNDVCTTNNWPSIEAPGYARGYVIADKWWRDLLAGLDWLRRERGMTIVLLAHSSVETVNDPCAPSYTSYQHRLHRRARGIVQDEMRCRRLGALAALRSKPGLHCQVALRSASENSLSQRFRRQHGAGAALPEGRTGTKSAISSKGDNLP